MDRLADLRSAFAARLARDNKVVDPNLIQAFANTRREKFLGAGPWHILTEDGYARTPSDDPALVYVDACVALDPERGINNGEPGLHFGLLAELAAQPGDHVVQVGVGGGYYTAIIARLVHPGGRVTAIEYDPDLARQAAQNLADMPAVNVICADGTGYPFDPADGIYVNAGATRPIGAWLDKLKPRGRLVMMLTTDDSWGQVLKVARTEDGYSAALLPKCGFIPCVNGRDEESEVALAAALAGGDEASVKSLRRDAHVSNETCWMHGEGICLSRRGLS